MKKQNIALLVLATLVFVYALLDIMGLARPIRLFMIFPSVLVLWPIPGALSWSWVDGLDPDTTSPGAIVMRIAAVSATLALFFVPICTALRRKRRWPFAISAVAAIWILAGGLYSIFMTALLNNWTE